MLNQSEQQDIRNEFRRRYDQYLVGGYEAGRSIPQAIRDWHVDTRTKLPIFTRDMWQVISGAQYPTFNEMAAERRLGRMYRQIKRIVKADDPHREDIIMRAFEYIESKRTWEASEAVKFARRDVRELSYAPADC